MMLTMMVWRNSLLAGPAAGWMHATLRQVKSSSRTSCHHSLLALWRWDKPDDRVPGSDWASLQADYLLDGREELIICSGDGEVRGYVPSLPSDIGDSKTGTENELLQQLSKQKAVSNWSWSISVLPTSPLPTPPPRSSSFSSSSSSSSSSYSFSYSAHFFFLVRIWCKR